jgi:hypothetical protein
MTILTEQAVIEIREAYASGVTQKELADLYRCRQTNISKIVRGDTRANVAGPLIQTGRASGERHGLSKLTTAQVKELRLHRELGYTFKELGVIFGIGQTQARQIALGLARKDG